jgi:hypothetical protein
MKGARADFDLLGRKATEILGHELRSGNLRLSEFRKLGFRIPVEPRKALLNHLLKDFFTKRSLPIPGSSYPADHSEEMATVMLLMYKNGLNLKTAGGNLIGYTMVQVIIHGYTFLFKAVPASNFSIRELSSARTKALVARKHSDSMAKKVSALSGEQMNLRATVEGLQEEHPSAVRAIRESIEDQVRIGTEQRDQLGRELLEAIGRESQSRSEAEADLRRQIHARSRWPRVVLWLMVCLGFGMSAAALLVSIK